MNTTKISYESFREEMRPLDRITRSQIEAYIFQNQNLIEGFYFAHTPGRRIFEIRLSDGNNQTWDTTRRRKRKFLFF